MKQLRIGKNISWIHFTNPNDRDIKELKAHLNVHPLILDELLNPSERSRVENHDSYLYLVYHLPIYNLQGRTSRRSEIDFLVTKKMLITVTYEELETVLQFGRDMEKDMKGEITSTSHALYYILVEAIDFSARQLTHVEKKVNFVGDQLFKQQNRKLLEEMSYIKRDLLDFSIIAVPQRATLDSLTEIATGFWGKDSKIYFSDLIGEFLKTQTLLQNLKATIDSYSETVSQIFEFKTSEVIRRFSILGFLTFPLILYATIALQPRVEQTFIQTPSDFWAYFGIIAAFIFVLAISFRKKGWL